MQVSSNWIDELRVNGESIQNWGILFDIDGMYQINSARIYPPGIYMYERAMNRRYKTLLDVYIKLYKEMINDHHRFDVKWPKEVKMIDYNDEYDIDITKLKDIIPEYFV